MSILKRNKKWRESEVAVGSLYQQAVVRAEDNM
jgi:hypothetical protein